MWQALRRDLSPTCPLQVPIDVVRLDASGLSEQMAVIRRLVHRLFLDRPLAEGRGADGRWTAGAGAAISRQRTGKGVRGAFPPAYSVGARASGGSKVMRQAEADVDPTTMFQYMLVVGILRETGA